MTTRRTRKRAAGAGTVRQLPSGRWQARYRDSTLNSMRSAPVTFDTKLDALGWLSVYADGDLEPEERRRHACGSVGSSWGSFRGDPSCHSVPHGRVLVSTRVLSCPLREVAKHQ